MSKGETDGRGRIAVVGLGYVGLPLVGACVIQGYSVVGFDVDTKRVTELLEGRSYVDDVGDDDVAQWRARGFLPTNKRSDITNMDIYVICVPTPLSRSGGPDLSAVESAAQLIEEGLPREVSTNRSIPLVVLESTTYPGTTEEVVKPILERNGLIAGRDFHLAFSPERIDPGNQEWTFSNTPKVLGGYTDECANVAEEFYASVTQRVVRTKGLKEAEMAKLLENTYRHVNIALVNELWKLSSELGIDIWDVIDAAETKPYGFQAFRPGPGVGGHCIPIDPNYLSHRVKTELGQPFRFVELAQEINASMPDFVMGKAQEILNNKGKSVKGSSILLLGVTYKPNIADMRESPAIPLINGLLKRGAKVAFADPFISEVATTAGTLERVVDAAAAIHSADLVIIVQHHDQQKELLERLDPRHVLDTRGTLR